MILIASSSAMTAALSAFVVFATSREVFTFVSISIFAAFLLPLRLSGFFLWVFGTKFVSDCLHLSTKFASCQPPFSKFFKFFLHTIAQLTVILYKREKSGRRSGVLFVCCRYKEWLYWRERAFKILITQ